LATALRSAGLRAWHGAACLRQHGELSREVGTTSQRDPGLDDRFDDGGSVAYVQPVLALLVRGADIDRQGPVVDQPVAIEHLCLDARAIKPCCAEVWRCANQHNKVERVADGCPRRRGIDRLSSCRRAAKSRCPRKDLDESHGDTSHTTVSSVQVGIPGECSRQHRL
jgi:hypothetical protein